MEMRLRKKAHFCFMCYSKGSNFLHVLSPPITDSMLFLYLVHLLILVLFARFSFTVSISLLYYLVVSPIHFTCTYLFVPMLSFRLLLQSERQT